MDRSSKTVEQAFAEQMDKSSWLGTAQAVANATEPLGEKTVVCEKHGEYAASGIRYYGRREIWGRCPDCKEQQEADERQAEAQKHADRLRAQMEANMGQAAIPPRFIGRTLENFNATTDEQRAALQVAQDFVADFERNLKSGKSLVFSGMPGTGKSHLATAVLQALMPRHCGLYVTCMGVIRHVRGTWRKDSEQSESAVLDIYGRVPLLVLDEIGVQYGTDGEQTILFDVLDRRYRDMMPSIFLTNQDKKGLKQFIGERTFDRLTETSKWIAFDWGSYRPTARKEAA